jgi:hypothetical protein
MATDSSELTFIRCPSCRSLVPAMSSKCRMCGAPLDSGTAAEAPQAPKSGRVRQRTTSASREDVESALQPYQPEAASAVQNHTEDLADDFDSFLPEEAEEPVVSATDPIDDLFGSDDDSSADDFADPLGLFEEAPPAPVSTISKTSAPEAEQPLPFARRAKLEPPTQEAAAKPVASAGDFEDDDEFMNARQAQRPVPAPAPRQRAITPSVSEDHEVAEEVVKSEQAAAPVPMMRERPAEKIQEEEVSYTHERFVEEEDMEEVVERPFPSEPMREAAVRPQAPIKKKVVSEPGQSGRLAGWLVSFASAQGTGVELREGKFFVTNSSLKPKDLVFDDESISTPHALMTVNSQEGVLIQDLMSEHGVHVKKLGSGKYQALNDSSLLEHGDWLKIGKLEFLVSLLPQVG